MKVVHPECDHRFHAVLAGSRQCRPEQVGAFLLQPLRIQISSVKRLIESLIAALGYLSIQVIAEQAPETGAIIEEVTATAHGIGGDGGILLNVYKRIERRQSERRTIPKSIKKQLRSVVVIEQTGQLNLRLRRTEQREEETNGDE